MSTDVLGYLLSKSLAVKPAPGNEVHLTCFFCGEDPSKRGRLYVNVDPEAEIPGLYQCKKCTAHGALPTIMRHFGDRTAQEEKEDDGFIRRAILVAAAKFYHENLDDNIGALRWLTNRGLTLETISDKQLGYANGGLYKHLRSMEFRVSDILATGLIAEDRASKKIGDFLKHHITIPYLVSGTPVMIRGRTLDPEDERKYVTPFGQKTRLYNTDVVWHADEIVIAEGELDCLIAEQMGFAAVAAPGCSAWQDTWDGYFSDARRVYVVFDNDVPGRRGAEKIVDRLGSKCRTVVLDEESLQKVDITDWAKQGHTTEDFAILLHRSAGGLLVRVADAIAEHRELQGLIGVRFGMAKLDRMIAPGLLPAQLMIPLASTGVGKTVWLINMFQRICLAQPDAKVLFVSLEQTRGDWWERARRIYRFFHLGASDADVENFWSEKLMLVDRNRITPEQLVQCIEDFDYEWGQMPTVVGLDYIGYYAQSFKGERYERVSDAVMSIKAVAKDLRVPIIAPHQVSRGNTRGTEPGIDDARDSGIIGETADFVLSLWSEDSQQGKKMEQRTGIFNMKVQKSRHGGAGYDETMRFAPLSLAMVPMFNGVEAATVMPERNDNSLVFTEGGPFWRYASDERTYQTTWSNTWEQALIRHEAGLTKDEPDFEKVLAALNKKRQGVLT